MGSPLGRLLGGFLDWPKVCLKTRNKVAWSPSNQGPSRILEKLVSVIELELLNFFRLGLEYTPSPLDYLKRDSAHPLYINQSYTIPQRKGTPPNWTRVLRYSSGLNEYKLLSLRLPQSSAYAEAPQTLSRVTRDRLLIVKHRQWSSPCSLEWGINMFLYFYVPNTHSYKFLIFQSFISYLDYFLFLCFFSFPQFYIPPFQKTLGSVST